VSLLDFLHSFQLLIGLHLNIGVDAFLPDEQPILPEAEDGSTELNHSDEGLSSLMKYLKEELNEELAVADRLRKVEHIVLVLFVLLSQLLDLLVEVKPIDQRVHDSATRCS